LTHTDRQTSRGEGNARTAASDAPAGGDHEPDGREEEAPEVLRAQGPEGVVPPVLLLLLLLLLLLRPSSCAAALPLLR